MKKKKWCIVSQFGTVIEVCKDKWEAKRYLKQALAKGSEPGFLSIQKLEVK